MCKTSLGYKLQGVLFVGDGSIQEDIGHYQDADEELEEGEGALKIPEKKYLEAEEKKKMPIVKSSTKSSSKLFQNSMVNLYSQYDNGNSHKSLEYRDGIV
jgi:hypothetical protein